MMQEQQNQNHQPEKEQIIVELVRYLASSLVDHPDEVEVRCEQGETSLVLELHVNQDDIGKVIGKQGRIAKAIRSVVKAAAVKHGVSVVLEIV